MWGPPGSMLAARTMHEWTGDARWRDAWQACADDVWSRWDEDGLWEVLLDGHTVRYLGPAHGFAGNVLALAQGGERLDEIGRRAAATAAREAVVEDGLATWPPDAGGPLVQRDGQMRVQWCHGAPGIVSSIGELLDDALLLGGAELTWQAGGLRKGPGLCHGTAGNGYALLKAFALTGDERWLDRARRFALHALMQVESRPPTHSLFTGGIGAALFAASCLEARYDFPTLDSF
jgi:lantibiotic modifying enzyme